MMLKNFLGASSKHSTKDLLLDYASSESTISVDAKINTLESEGKCSPSTEKSTKRASQFDLKLTLKKRLSKR